MVEHSLGSVMSRLAGLKNISGRRVMPGAEFMQDFDNRVSPEEIEGISNDIPTQNLPKPDLGGDLTSQSYDVRANDSTPPQEDEGMWGSFRKLGANLWNNFKEGWTPGVSDQTRQAMGIKSAAQTPPIETAQVDEQEGLPPVTASEQQYSLPGMIDQTANATSNIFDIRKLPEQLRAVSDYFNLTKRNEQEQANKDLLQKAQVLSSGQNPEEVKNAALQKYEESVKNAAQRPWQYAVYGSANQVANHPALKAQFKQITGIDYEPQIAKQVSDYENSMEGVEDSLNGLRTNLDERSEQIKNRILNNQTTDSDKFYIGLALLMPLIVGGVFGKEAGLGALAGGAKGYADVLGNREKNIREDEESLLGIDKQKLGVEEKLADINLEKSKLGPALRKALPDDKNEHLIGMREGVWQDPVTGQEVRGVEIKPGLIARPEFIATKEGKADMLKAANELSETKNYVDEVNDLTEDVINIVSQLKDPSFAWKGFASLLSGKAPTMLSQLTEDVMIDGRKVNAGVALEEKLGFLANAYGMAKNIGQLDRAAQTHIKKIFENPTNTFLTPEDSLNQVLEVRKLAQRGLIKAAENKGFYPEFVIAGLEKANNPLFQGLNQREDEKYNEQLKRKAMQSEFNYAQ